MHFSATIGTRLVTQRVWWRVMSAKSSRPSIQSRRQSNLSLCLLPSRNVVLIRCSVLLDSLMQALTSGLAFIPGPESLIAKSVLNGAAQSGFITKLVMPMGDTANTQLEEMQDLAANASQLMSQMQSQIAQTLPPIQNDGT